MATQLSADGTRRLVITATTPAALEATLANIVGQALVALELGCDIHLEADRSGSGTCWIRNPNGGELPTQVLRTVAVAGPIAEAAFLHGEPGDLLPAALMDLLQSETASLSPLAQGYTLADVAFALGVLTTYWALVEEEVADKGKQIMNGGALPH